MFDLFEKARNPRINADSGITLATRLALGADLSDEHIRAAVRKMTFARDEVTGVQQERDRFQPESLRAAMTPVATSFTSMHSALGAIAVLPEGGERSRRAAAALALLLPFGVAFASGDASGVHNGAQRAIARAGEDGLGAEIDALIGPEFLEAARRTTEQLGEVLGVGRAPVRAPSSTALQQKLGRLSRAIGHYLRAEAARVDEDDPASIARFVEVLGPVDAHREATRRRGASTEPESDGDPVPADPTDGPGADPTFDPTGPGGPFTPET